MHGAIQENSLVLPIKFLTRIILSCLYYLPLESPHTNPTGTLFVFTPYIPSNWKMSIRIYHLTIMHNNQQFHYVPRFSSFQMVSVDSIGQCNCIFAKKSNKQPITKFSIGARSLLIDSTLMVCLISMWVQFIKSFIS